LFWLSTANPAPVSKPLPPIYVEKTREVPLELILLMYAFSYPAFLGWNAADVGKSDAMVLPAT
jgi:hypothetical protein